ncbi:TetR/AcrR family transcriptional regulator [Tenggerimyces flavus]|uniref:TetR/AcrR family transcriptional regulator n=1 Tax=Tenggerimyces flavus TaxID=1708749 RepID=A0ABV7Y424_9ACTN|nr:TetR/AcrR family transcriptional regulator [Tenggerimyces flavus]MBM7790597.1 AcrR family transcriptional regulator [Tenggerimyces flavus]
MAALRRDARENVEKLTAAATRVFVAQGLGAPLDEVARAAGVSTGTLYNRFGSREALIDAIAPALVASRMAAVAADAESEPDAWGSFARYVSGLLELQVECPAQDDILTRRFPESRELTTLCDVANRQAVTYLEAAQATGAARADVDAHDLTALFAATSGILRSAGPEACRRHLRLVLAGLRI